MAETKSINRVVCEVVADLSGGKLPVHFGRIVEECWRREPVLFRLKGAEGALPDSRKVSASFHKLILEGFLVRPSQEHYLPGWKRHNGNGVAANGKEISPVIKKLLDTEAYHLWKGGLRGDVSFLKACRFWGVTEADHKDVLLSKVESFDVLLASGDTEEERLLRHCHEYLKERFKTHLGFVRTGAGRPKKN